MKEFVRRHQTWLVATLYIVSAFAVYGWYLNNPFIMDDKSQILNNPFVHSFHFFSYFLSSTIGSGGSATMRGAYYKPLMTTFYALVWRLAGADPAAYRAPLLLLHALSATFIFVLSRRWLRAFTAFWIGVLFLLHPINSEVVLYIADAQDVLFLFFGLSALLWFTSRSAGWRSGVVLGILLAASLLSKETGALFMGIVIVHALLFERSKLKEAFAAVVLVAIPYCILRINAGLVHLGNPMLLFHHASWGERLRMLPLILWHYFEIFIFPWRISLAPDFVLTGFTWTGFWLPLVSILILVTAFQRWYRGRRDRHEKRVIQFCLAILSFWFVLHTHLIVALDGVYTDRWFYIAAWPSLVLIAFMIKPERLQSKAAMTALILILIAFVARDEVRAQDWRHPSRLYRREYALHPQDAIMANNVGVEDFRAGRIAEAEKYFAASIQSNPYFYIGESNLGATFEREGKTAAALQAYKRSIDLGSYPLADENYAKLLFRLHRDDECRAFLTQKGLRDFPQNPVLLAIMARLK